MTQSQSLEFILYAAGNKPFCVQFESEGENRNLLMEVIYDGLPLDTVQIRQYDAQLYTAIKEQMHLVAANYWQQTNIKI